MIYFILAIVAIIAACILVFKFWDIEEALFRRYADDPENYEPFGVGLEATSIIGGAILGVIYFINYKYGEEIDPMILVGISGVLLAIITSASLFQACLNLKSTGVIIGKTLFMFVMCAVSMAVGAIAGIVIIAILIFVLCVLIVGLIVGNMFMFDKVINVNGITKRVMSIGFGKYKDSSGNVYVEE